MADSPMAQAMRFLKPPACVCRTLEVSRVEVKTAGLSWGRGCL